jgi:GNAT superfamily N-acetyltransferase
MVQIRSASLEDVPLLQDLMAQLGYPLDPLNLVQNVNAYLDDPDRALLVAEVGGRGVGCMAIDIAQTFHREGKHMRIVSLVVDHSWRGKGVGKGLLGAAEEMARQRGCWVIELTSSSRREADGTHDFYIDQGYVKNSSQAYFHKLLNM